MRRALIALFACSLLVLVGCGDDKSASDSASTAPSSTLAPATITVSAAASLTEAFTTIAKTFEKDNPGTHVALNFGPSSRLSDQIVGGAAADVFASADEQNMTKVVNAKLLDGKPTTFATNELTIVVKAGNPSKVKSLKDLENLRIVALCGEQVPCGIYAAQALTNAGVTLAPEKITRGEDAKATLAAVTQGDADAAIVYVTDAKAAKTAGSDVDEVKIAAADNVTATYPIGALKASVAPATAKAFIEAVTSEAGQKVLAQDGFSPP